MTADLKRNALLNDSLGTALRSGDHALGTIPGLLKQVLADGTWRDFVTKRGEHVEWDRFTDFVTRPPLKGLGADADLLYRVAPDLTSELDQAFGRKQRSDKIVANLDNIQESDDLAAPTGTSRRAALRRLRKDRPDLYAQVKEGKVSANWAMVEAKFRPRTLSVQVTRPESVARALLKHMSADDIAKLIAVLLGKDGS
jgi:hypothetical protein